MTRGESSNHAAFTKSAPARPPRAIGRSRLADLDGFPIDNPADRYVFRSSEILRERDGAFAIWVSAAAHAGNWLPIGAPAPFALVLRLYDSPLSATAGGIEKAAAPSVVSGRAAREGVALDRATSSFTPSRRLSSAALAHFVIVLAIPMVAEHDAYATLSALGAGRRDRSAAAAAPTRGAFPTSTPASPPLLPLRPEQGTGAGAGAAGRRRFFSISFHSRRGAVFYALTDRAAAHGKHRGGHRDARRSCARCSAADDEDNPSQDLRIVSPTADGFVLTRVFSELPSLTARPRRKPIRCMCERAHRGMKRRGVPPDDRWTSFVIEAMLGT